MMRIIPYLIFLISLSLETKSQDTTILPGAYRNPVDFANGVILYQNHEFFLKKHIRQKRFPNSYDIFPGNPNISQEMLELGVWVIYRYGCIYLNAKRHGLNWGFIRIRYTGNYLYLKAERRLSPIDKNEIAKTTFEWGGAAGMSQAIHINNFNKGQIHYVLNIKKGTTNLLTREYVERILKLDKTLHQQFLEEPNNGSLEVLKKYLELINEKNLVL